MAKKSVVSGITHFFFFAGSAATKLILKWDGLLEWRCNDVARRGSQVWNITFELHENSTSKALRRDYASDLALSFKCCCWALYSVEAGSSGSSMD